MQQSIVDALTARSFGILLDHRSPSEYQQGHIPGAISLPLFSDEERAEVGTIYKQSSAELAFEKGLEFVGPKMAKFVRAVRTLNPKNLAITSYCWRGGQRSQSMAWLLGKAGFQVDTILGGYKAYRNFIQQYFAEQPLRMMILGGKTGSGKTEILKELEAQGEQILDLEGLANHKGSAFGSVMEYSQPSTEHFENLLFEQYIEFDTCKTVWVENESRLIGKVHIHQAIWDQMKSSPVIYIDMPIEDRIAHLVHIYGDANVEDLKLGFDKIKKRIGGLDHKNAIAALDHKDLETATKIALDYYDKTYKYLLQTNDAPNIYHLTIEKMNFKGNAEAIIQFVDELKIGLS